MRILARIQFMHTPFISYELITKIYLCNITESSAFLARFFASLSKYKV